MLQSSSFTSCVLTEIGRQECSWFGFFIQCTCTQCHQSQIDCSLMTGGGSIQCPYNNGRLSLPFTPICNHREKVITLILHMRISMVLHLQHRISRTKHTKVPHHIFWLCTFFYSIPFFLHVFLFWEKRGDCDDDAANW